MAKRSKGGKLRKAELGKSYFSKTDDGKVPYVGVAAACWGKHPFTSYDAAARSIRRVGRSGKTAGRLGPYHCQACGSYHVGSRY